MLENSISQKKLRETLPKKRLKGKEKPKHRGTLRNFKSDMKIKIETTLAPNFYSLMLQIELVRRYYDKVDPPFIERLKNQINANSILLSNFINIWMDDYNKRKIIEKITMEDDEPISIVVDIRTTKPANRIAPIRDYLESIKFVDPKLEESKKVVLVAMKDLLKRTDSRLYCLQSRFTDSTGESFGEIGYIEMKTWMQRKLHWLFSPENFIKHKDRSLKSIIWTNIPVNILITAGSNGRVSSTIIYEDWVLDQKWFSEDEYRGPSGLAIDLRVERMLDELVKEGLLIKENTDFACAEKGMELIPSIIMALSNIEESITWHKNHSQGKGKTV